MHAAWDFLRCARFKYIFVSDRYDASIQSNSVGVQALNEFVRILIVDDDEDDAYLIADTLREVADACFEVDVAPNWNEGLENIRQKSFDVILCDYRLGAKTGIDFLDKVRLEGCDIPFILLTGVGNKSVDEAASKAGAADFLAKDEISPESLDRTIRYAIANHSRQQLLHAVVNNVDATILVTNSENEAVLWNASFANLAEREGRCSVDCPIELLRDRIARPHFLEFQLEQVPVVAWVGMDFRGFHVVAQGIEVDIVVAVDNPAAKFDRGDMAFTGGAEAHNEPARAVRIRFLVRNLHDGGIEKCRCFHRVFRGKVRANQ